jgi:hypothetical protein
MPYRGSSHGQLGIHPFLRHGRAGGSAGLGKVEVDRAATIEFGDAGLSLADAGSAAASRVVPCGNDRHRLNECGYPASGRKYFFSMVGLFY